MKSMARRGNEALANVYQFFISNVLTPRWRGGMIEKSRNGDGAYSRPCRRLIFGGEAAANNRRIRAVKIKKPKLARSASACVK